MSKPKPHIEFCVCIWDLAPVKALESGSPSLEVLVLFVCVIYSFFLESTLSILKRDASQEPPISVKSFPHAGMSNIVGPENMGVCFLSVSLQVQRLEPPPRNPPSWRGSSRTARGTSKARVTTAAAPARRRTSSFGPSKKL